MSSAEWRTHLATLDRNDEKAWANGLAGKWLDVAVQAAQVRVRMWSISKHTSHEMA